MRLNDRAIREVLRDEAASVAPPPDLWDRIDSELHPSSPQGAQASRMAVRSPLRVRRLIAVGAAAGIFWMLVLPAGLRWKAGETLESRPGAVQVAAPPDRTAAAKEGSGNGPSHTGVRQRSTSRAASDLQWPSPEIALLR